MQPIKPSADGVKPAAAAPGQSVGETTGEAFSASLREVIEAATGQRLGAEQIRNLLDGRGNASMSREQLLALLAARDTADASLAADALASRLGPSEPDANGDGETVDGTGIDIGAWLAALVDAKRTGVHRGDAAGLRQGGALDAGGKGIDEWLARVARDADSHATQDGARAKSNALEAPLSGPEEAGRPRDTGFAGLLSGVQGRASPAGAGTPPTTMQLATPMGQPGFTRGVAEQVTWMVRNDTQSARVTLDPPDLGPLEISVSTQDDRTSVSIAAHHAGTRDALMADSGRLRAMLADNGFAGVEVNVRDGNAGGSDAQGSGSGGEGGHSGDGGGSGAAGVAETRQTAGSDSSGGSGLVDHYV